MTTKTAFVRAAFVAVLPLGVVALQGQTQAPVPSAAGATQAILRTAIAVGRSTVLATDFDITRVAITNPAIADATVVESRAILLDGKSPGTVSLIIWGPTPQRVQYDVVVDPGVSPLQRQLQLLFPGEDIQANETPDAVILTGHASNNNVMLRAGEIAEAVSPKMKVVNMLVLPGGNGSQQVMLQVRIAEVNRHAVTELGAAFFSGASGNNGVIGRVTTQQFAAPDFSNLNQSYDSKGNLLGATGSSTLSDFLNVFLFSTKLDLGVVIRALQTHGNFQSLAEPNLMAYNGQEASFLAGGELPIPVVQGVSGAVSVQFKEFGVRLTFRPTIAGDVIRLRVKPEVSSLDFADGVTLGGFRIPAITTRRAETEVELRDGQSFAIGGLMNNSAQDTKQQIPGLGSIPIIGSLFKSKSTTQDQTELLVLVTPRLVRPLNPDEVPALPTLPEKFLPPCAKPPCGGTPPAPVKKKGGGSGG